eukprot:TRINITY_DN3619_c0_g1_i4.p1 TRINITY_DN3619_c0_g1~~TRINITY_DN3619_c0_g1_i4.p1  ORF type:complete len:324 (+),score=55.17 TRINITY_DN3619_c0_g1_i4:147-1118(+)
MDNKTSDARCVHVHMAGNDCDLIIWIKLNDMVQTVGFAHWPSGEDADGGLRFEPGGLRFEPGCSIVVFDEAYTGPDITLSNESAPISLRLMQPLDEDGGKPDFVLHLQIRPDELASDSFSSAVGGGGGTVAATAAIRSTFNGQALSEDLQVCVDSKLTGELVLRDLDSATGLHQLLHLFRELYFMHFERSSSQQLIYSAPSRPPPHTSDWQDVLYSYVISSSMSGKFYEDSEFTVVYDGYPKAKYHLLLLPRGKAFRRFSVSNLRSDHLEMLMKMRNRARWIIYRLGESWQNFRVGFHSVPSLNHLHMHIIVSVFFVGGALRR